MLMNGRDAISLFEKPPVINASRFQKCAFIFNTTMLCGGMV